MSLRLPKRDLTKKKSKTNSRPLRIETSPKTVIASIPTMILVGGAGRTNEVGEELNKQGIRAKKVPFIKDLKKFIDGSEVGIIYVAPLRRSHILSVHKNLRKDSRLKEIPFFAVVPAWVSSRVEREMYKSGIRMIFEWPKEKQTFASLMSTAISVGLEPVRTNDTDKSLKKAIENRMSAEYGQFDPDVKTIVYNGIVILRGEMNSAANKKKLVGCIKKIPGTRGVVDHSLKVIKAEVSPLALKKKGNEVLEHIPGAQSKTMEVLVRKDNKKLILTGTASKKRSVDIAKQHLERLYGVGEVDSRVIVSPVVHKKDLYLAERAHKIARKITQSSEGAVKVKVSAGVVLLKGRVQNGVESSLLSKAIESLNGVTRVDDLLQVAQPA